jgi:hypothetical protein
MDHVSVCLSAAFLKREAILEKAAGVLHRSIEFRGLAFSEVRLSFFFRRLKDFHHSHRKRHEGPASV